MSPDGSDVTAKGTVDVTGIRETYTMYRRRLLALACVAVAGCTDSEYRATGPRTPPRAPPPRSSGTSGTTGPVEARAQAVIRPLNEAYRALRDPLVTFEVDEVSRADRSAVAESVTSAREAMRRFSAAVTDPPERYRSLSALVRAHELLAEALTAAVDLFASLSQLDAEAVDDPTAWVAPLRSPATRLASTGTDLRSLAETDPVVPDALFLTRERLRTLADTIISQSTAIDRLLDVSLAALAGAVDWRAGITAFERGAFTDARSAFEAARTDYRTASDWLAAGLGAEGSFADLAEGRSCRVTAALEATVTALDAVASARNGDVARADTRLQAARTTRNRCATG